jgi:uncharacterized membrane protein
MKNILSACYIIALSLWVGGISIFTFVVTPALFRSFDRDLAGRIVGALFSGYFFYNLALAIIALLLLLALGSFFTPLAHRWSLVLVAAALIINLFVAFKLHPEIRQVKQEVHSFEGAADDSPARKKFRKLHALSAVLNLLLLADGTVLLVVAGVFRK